ncbi:hypothetical protein Aperf_G00000089920 [Anoplocephala perfoliata]
MSTELLCLTNKRRYEISNLPTGTVVDISKYLTLLDKISACSAVPGWKWILSTPRVLNEFRHRICEWLWMDKRLYEICLRSSQLTVDDLCEMVRYQQDQQNSFLKKPSSAPRSMLRCLALGPAVDRIGLMNGFYRTLLSVIDLSEERQMFSSPPGSIILGIPIRIPSQTGPGSEDILVDISTLQARVKSRRAVETSRIRDSFIIIDGNLSEKACSMIKSSDFIFYFVTIQADQADWREIRFELSRISKALSINQILYVIGMCDGDSENWDFFGNVVEIARNLNGSECAPLAESVAKWRVWVLKHNGYNCANLEEIIQWASYDVTAVRNANRQNSNLFLYLYDLFLSPFR